MDEKKVGFPQPPFKFSAVSLKLAHFMNISWTCILEKMKPYPAGASSLSSLSVPEASPSRLFWRRSKRAEMFSNDSYFSVPGRLTVHRHSRGFRNVKEWLSWQHCPNISIQWSLRENKEEGKKYIVDCMTHVPSLAGEG